jgi:hypothetical protein
MPSTDSSGPEKVDAMPSEWVVDMARNEWTASIGIDGRHGPDYAPRLLPRYHGAIYSLTPVFSIVQNEIKSWE